MYFCKIKVLIDNVSLPMVERALSWQNNHRGRILFLLSLPLIVYAWSWGSEKYQAEFGINEECPIYKVVPRNQDDTLRVLVIGDSWAEYHMTLECDTIFCRFAKKYTSAPVKCFTRGHSGKITKEIYNEMFTEHTVEHSWERDHCLQPLIEQHPDYCVIMAGINDMRLCKPESFYVGNYLLMLNLLVRNGIKPVVMEMPGVDLKYFHEKRRFYRRWMFDVVSLWTKIDYGSVQVYRDAMKRMLQETGMDKQVLFIPVSSWNPGGIETNPEYYIDDRLHLNMNGYHVMDSCMAVEIVRDYQNK